MGAMFQIGALAALEDKVEGLQANDFDLFLGSSAGASVAAALAGGLPVQRIYRAFLDPADVYFGLERGHLLRVDLGEWRRTVVSAALALRHGASSLLSGKTTEMPARLAQELDRLYDSLPAGIFTLDGYERFLEAFFVRRAVPNAKIIGFPRGAGSNIGRYIEQIPTNAVGLDWMMDLNFARDVVQKRRPVQGNLDPLALRAGGAALDRSVDAILAAFAGGPFIFNLGHGILPDTPIAHVEQMIRRVRG